jgi:hypothetical protein
MKPGDFLDPSLFVPILLIVALCGPALYFARRSRRASDAKLLDDWAAENELKVIRASRRSFFLGPLTWRHAKGIGFRVSVRTRGGEQKSGWLVFAYDAATYSFLSPPDVQWDT